jgi:hypothetical protein
VKKKRRRKARQLVPRLGPPTNLRAAGVHQSRKRYDRKRGKDEFRQEIEAEAETAPDS